MWAMNVSMSWRKVIALSGTVAPAKARLGSIPRCLTQFGPLGTRVRQRHRRVLADGKLALPTLEHVGEGPATTAAFHFELQPLTVAVLAAFEARRSLGGERVLQHRS